MGLAEPFCFRAIRQFDCALELLPGSPPIKSRAPVHFHAGTAEIEAEVRLFHGETTLAPGGRTYARIVLRERALLVPGDRFIVRRFSPVTTIGGGVVLDIALDIAPARTAVNARERLERIEKASTPEWIHWLIRESGAGMPLEELTARTGLLPGQIDAAVRGSQEILALPGWLVDRAWFDSSRATLLARIQEFHRLHPLLAGIPKQDLRSGIPPELLDAILTHPEIALEGELARHRAHRVVLQPEEEQARARIEAAFENAGFTVPSVNDVLAASQVEPARARTLLQILLREKRLLRITDDLVFHQSAIERLRRDLATLKGERFSVAEFKQRAGISRKYAIPLLEYLDREKITRREGDQRVVL
jgi:selenocysteine-specific elongation factor